MISVYSSVLFYSGYVKLDEVDLNQGAWVANRVARFAQKIQLWIILNTVANSLMIIMKMRYKCLPFNILIDIKTNRLSASLSVCVF